MADMSEAGKDAWNTGKLRFILELLLNKFDKDKIIKELDWITK